MKIQRILVTGGAGFIGSHLVMRLLESGLPVRVFDNFDPQVHGDRLLRRWKTDDTEFLDGDVSSPEACEQALEGISHVVHFAAAVGVGQSMYAVRQYCDTNVMGTASLLQAIIDVKPRIQKLLVASSMSIYGEGLYECHNCSGYRENGREHHGETLEFPDWDRKCSKCGSSMAALPTPESKDLQPASVYAINKRDQEELCRVIGRAHEIPSVALRFFNVYGPGQALGNPYTGVAAIFASRLLVGKPPLIFEDGQQSRDFIHVDDVASACTRALTTEEVGDVSLNIGTGWPTTVNELAEALRAELSGPAPKVLGTHREGDIRHCYADIGQARKVLDWEPTIKFEEGLGDLVKWVREQVDVRDRVSTAVAELDSHGLIT
jgi:dTDP-L-rhamnose 4-epimerase